MSNHGTNRRPTSRSRRAILLLAAFALIAVSCSGGNDGEGNVDAGASSTTAEPGADTTSTTEDAGEPQLGGELVVGILSETNSWYPPELEAAFSAGALVIDAIYETMYVRTGTGELIPQLADGPPVVSEDSTQWTVTLRPGITFHDGTALDTDAVLAMNALWEDGRFATPGEGVESIDKVDDLTFTYNLFEPDPAFGDILQGTYGIAFSPTAAAAFGEDAASNPVGTGPFVFRSWTRDSELVVTRNTNYWVEGLPYLDRITFRVLPDGDSRRASIAAGDLDISTQGGATGVQDLLDSGLVTYEYLGNGAGVVIFNTIQAPTDDVRVRRGLSAALNPASAAAILNSNLAGASELRSQYFSETSTWYNEEAGAGYAFYDVAAAQVDLDAYVNDPARSDGKAVGEPISITYECNSEPENLQVAQLYQQEWGDVGVEVELATLEQSTFVTKIIGGPGDTPAFAGDFVASCWADGTESDPLSLFDTRYGAVADNVLNWTNYTNPAIDEQVEILRSTGDVDARYAATGEITRITAEAMPIYWGPTGATNVVAKTSVKNVEGYTHADGTPGTRRPAGTVWWHEVFVDGAQPIEIPTEFVEVPELVATTTTSTEPPIVLPGPDEAIVAVIPTFEDVGSSAIVQQNPPADAIPQCPEWEPLRDLSPISINTRSLAGATDFGPFLSITIYDMVEGEADLLIDAYLEGAAGPCAAYTDRAATGAQLNLGWAEGEGPTYAERSVTLFVRGDADGFPVNSDVVLMRQGTYFGLVSLLTIGGLPDEPTRDTAASLLEQALQSLG